MEGGFLQGRKKSSFCSRDSTILETRSLDNRPLLYSTVLDFERSEREADGLGLVSQR